MIVLAEHGDEILLPEPAYATYEGVMATTGASVVHVPLHASREFGIDPADVAARIADRTRVLVSEHARNPTGARIPMAVLDELGALAARTTSGSSATRSTPISSTPESTRARWRSAAAGTASPSSARCRSRTR